MARRNNFSCIIIGSGTLPIRCAEILLENGHEICAFVSTEAEIRRWSEQRNIVCLEHAENLSEQFKNKPFDYLFSIVNEHILPAEILNLPSRLAINYHDAPLPRYAGTHATSWAIMNGESVHGITWHVISDTVDAGDILRQQRIEITENETALTLNTKCYEAAINSFARLIDELTVGTVQPQKQNLGERSFFARFKRPVNGCLISWNNSAAEISRFVRALSFGANPNPLGSPKFVLKNNFFIISEIEVLNSAAAAAPGTINKIGDDFLQISAIDREIVLRHILRLDGQPVSIAKLTTNLDLFEGYRLRDLEPEMARRLDNLYRMTCKQEKFWVGKLSALKPAVMPYTDSTVLPGMEKPAILPLPVPARILRFLEERRPEWKPDDFLLVSFALLLARLSGADYFDIGYKTPELLNEIDGLENFYASELPLSFSVDFSQTFTELFNTGKEQIESFGKRRAFPRDIIARYPQFRNKSRLKEKLAFPVSVEKVKRLGDYQLEKSSELKLVISETESECLLIYDRARFSEEKAKKIESHFTTLLCGIADRQDSKIAQLPLLTLEEREKLLVEWNDNRMNYPKNQCIHQLFEKQSARSPDAVAVIFGEERLTYKELNRRANRLAHYLQKQGVKPETLVGIRTTRSIEMIVGVLGVLKAGGAYVPLDPNYPKERLELMLEDSKAPILLTNEMVSVEQSPHRAKIVCLDRDWENIADESEENPVSSVTPTNLAYVIYTSGSTGKPKGVAIEHRSAVAFLYWALSVFTPEQLKGVLASTSLCFDLSIYEMFAPLACGGKIVLVENVLHLPDAPAANEVTLINTVPSAITELLRNKGIPASVKTVNLAGEPLKTTLVERIYALGSVERVFDLYGPTEDTTYSTFTLRNLGAATIGRPISNTQAYILDKFLEPVPVGTPGELYLGGDGLARGYLNQPELTGERFVKNPFDNNPSSRLYKTGDLVRFLSSGEIEYLGRIDNQVKIRGFRIELGEIEALLLAQETVREAVVMAREDQPGDKRLVAYVVAARPQSFKTNELRTYLKQKLPDYMIPSAFVELAEMPLTPNGKVDRKALPQPATNLSDDDRVFVSHRDSMEQQLTEIWEKILNVQPIGIRDDFFELGGHSLQAVRMFAEIEKNFNKNIPLATLFEAGTIEQLAEILRQDGWAEPESSLVPIQPKGEKPIFFCLHAKGGNVLFYRDLARHLGEDQPFYGIQARRLGGRQVGHHDIREMAEFYIREIQTLQPEGPYFLGGSSFGGLAAFEMARQLQASGQEVALVALLDTGTPDYPKLLPETTRYRQKFYRLVRRVQQQRDKLKILNLRQKIEYANEKLKKIRLKYRRKIRDNYKKAVRMGYQKIKGKGAVPKSYIQLEDQLWRAGQNYVPEFYAGNITLFRATLQPLGIQPDPTLGWKDFVGGELEIHEVPGHHGSIVVEPYVAVLAEKLRQCLEIARSKERQLTIKRQSVNRNEREVVRA